MKTVEVELPGRAGDLQGLPGIAFSQAPLPRTTKVEPALAAVLRPGIPYEWEYVATRENEVPPDVLRAASAIKIGIVDTGADVTHPDLAAKSPETWDVVHRRTNVADKDGHGTFVAPSRRDRSRTARGSQASAETRSSCWSGRSDRRTASATSTRRPRSSTPSTTARGSST